MIKDERVMMNFRVPKEVRRRFRTECMERDMTANQVMVELLKNQLTHWERQGSVRP
jgi:hypothetical protein